MQNQRWIISASRRTDIPAFYTEWLFHRMDAGYCWVRNPFGGPPTRVSLLPDDVVAFVFWSKWYQPLLDRFDHLAQRGFGHVYCHFTITGYPREIEVRVPPADRAVSQMHALAGRVGAAQVVWRYDPIVCTELTPLEWHRENFLRLADRLAGATRQVYVSFVSLYRKTQRNLDELARRPGGTWFDPPAQLRLDLTAELVEIARERSMVLKSCCDDSLGLSGAEPGRCIDAEAIRRLTGEYDLRLPTAPSREQCGCCRVRDIGAYDTCPFGCVYCYANASPRAGRAGYQRVDQHAEALGPRERHE